MPWLCVHTRSRIAAELVVPARERARGRRSTRARSRACCSARSACAPRRPAGGLAVLGHHVRDGRQLLQARERVALVGPRCGERASARRPPAESIARSACALRSHSTPSRWPSRYTPTSPGSDDDAARSTSSNRESARGGCSTRPCSSPGGARSWMKLGRARQLGGQVDARQRAADDAG